MGKFVALVSALVLGTQSWAYATEPPVPSETTLQEISLPEIPGSLALANNGAAAMTYADRKSVGLLSVDEKLSEVNIGCAATQSAISKTGDRVWAICVDNPHLFIIDSNTKVVSVANLNLKTPVFLDYLPKSQQIVTLGTYGELSLVSATSLEDYAIRNTAALNVNVSAAEIDDDEKFLYIATVGAILIVDLETLKMETFKLQSPTIYLTSLALSPDQKLLYGAGTDSSIPAEKAPTFLAVMRIADRVVMDQKFLTTNILGFGMVLLAPSHRNLYVSSGLGVKISEQSSTSNGIYSVGLLEGGTFGQLRNFYPESRFANAMAFSPDRRLFAVGTTSASLARVRVSDSPYPVAVTPTPTIETTTTAESVEKTITAKANYKGKNLTISGTAAGFKSGMKVKVYLRDLAKKTIKFSLQKKSSSIDAKGKFTWSRTIQVTNVEAYLRIGSIKSTILKPKKS